MEPAPWAVARPRREGPPRRARHPGRHDGPRSDSGRHAPRTTGRGRGARLQRGREPRGQRHARCDATWTSPFRSAPSSPSSTTAAPTAPPSWPSVWRPPCDGVQAMILSRKGRGYALRTAWSASEAEVVAYMDVDLSTSLSALLPLVGSVLSGHSDLAVGTRLARGFPRRPRPQTRAHLTGLQPHRATLAAEPPHRLPVRLQGHPARARAADPAARRGQRVVLRHRADRHGRTSRCAHQ